MNISVIIPQVFYDLIARILPGVFFSVLAMLSFPDWAAYVTPLASAGTNNFIQSLGQGFVYAVLCYFLGLLFISFSSETNRKEAKAKNEAKGEKSLNIKFLRIRLANSDEGFRILKLRAEARMFQATRTGMIAIIGLAVFYIAGMGIIYKPPFWPLENAFWLRPALGLLIASVSFVGFGTYEAKAWDYYWTNVRVIYSALHENANLVPPAKKCSSDPIKPLVQPARAVDI